MAVTAYVWPNVDYASVTKTFNLGASADNLYVLLIATGTFTWSAGSFTPRGYTTNSQFLAGDGTNGALGEVSTSGTSYTRQQLTSVSVSTPASGQQVTTLTCANPTWPSSSITAKYALFFDAGTGGSGTSAGDSSNNKLLCYWDFGGSNQSQSGSFTLTISGSGLITWTAS